MESRRVVLLVQAEVPERADLARRLECNDGLRAELASTGCEALQMLDNADVDVVLTDLHLKDMGGLDFVVAVSKRFPDVPVVVTAAEASLATAIEAMKQGAADFLVRPFEPAQLELAVASAITRRATGAHLPPAATLGTPGLLGEAASLREVNALIQRAASSNGTVLLRGESGTGKDLAARAIHECSSRSSMPFIKIHCGAVPDALLESELFGYERGAFTGAGWRKPGRVELAEGGTLFLDEIGDISQAMQVKLLRLLQDREIERLGGTRTIKVDVRFVAATHRDVDAMMTRGEFREDLFYRLNVLPIWLPPLRTRRKDIPLLARHFCRVFAAAHGKPNLVLADDAIEKIKAGRWPGNVRQLQNTIERLVVFSDGPLIDAAHIDVDEARQATFVTEAPTGAGVGAAQIVADRSPELSSHRRDAECKALQAALHSAGGNRTLAARILGVSRRTLYYKLADYGLGVDVRGVGMARD